jgi:hypothetical protein
LCYIKGNSVGSKVGETLDIQLGFPEGDGCSVGILVGDLLGEAWGSLTPTAEQ